MSKIVKRNFKKFKPYVWTRFKKAGGVVVERITHVFVYVPEFKGGQVNVTNYGLKRVEKTWTRVDVSGNPFQVKGFKYIIKLANTPLNTSEYIRVADTPNTPFDLFEKIVITEEEFETHPILEIEVDGSNLPGGKGTSTVNLDDSDEP